MFFRREIIRIGLWPCLGILLSALVVAPTLLQKTGRTDLQIIHLAAQRLEAHIPVYLLSDGNEHTKPPFATLLFVPLLPLPFPWLARIWDFLNIALFLFLTTYFARRLTEGKPLVTGVERHLALLGVLFTLNSWNQEIRLGQTNVITLALLVFAGLTRRPFAWGGLAVVAVLLKPTNMLFLPWVFFASQNRRQFILSCAALTGTLAVAYGLRYGFSSVIQDHLTWLHFLPASTEKHLYRADNYALTRWLLQSALPSTAVGARVLGVVVVTASAYRAPGKVSSLAVAGIVSCLLSPMAWFQNFVLLLPFSLIMLARWTRAERAGERWGLTVVLLCLYVGFQIYNPTFCAMPFFQGACAKPVPLIALLAALVFAVAASLGGAPRPVLREEVA